MRSVRARPVVIVGMLFCLLLITQAYGEASANTSPTAVDDFYETVEDISLSVEAPGVLLNDTVGEGGVLSAVKVDGPSHGTFTLTADGSFTYTPDANYHGTDSFTYLANDGTLDSVAATVTITVTPVNDAPVAVSDSATVDEDGSVEITLSATDIDGDELTYAIVGTPAHGMLGPVAADKVTYTPDANYHGTDSFTFKANDGTLDSVAATVTITVTPVNDAPVAVSQSATVDEDGSVEITLSATDIDADELTYAIVGTPAHGTLGPVAIDKVTYTPDANYHGTDSFTYLANDGTLDSVAATVTITVTPVNDAPVAVSDSATVAEDGSVEITLSATDIDGDELTYAIVGTPAHGMLGPLNADKVTYTPDANYHGTDSFTFKANDGTLDSVAATVTITVTPVNDAPVAVSDSYETAEDKPLSVKAPGVLGNDTDADDDDLSSIKVAGPSHGMLALAADGSFTYTPSLNWFGKDSFTYSVSDGTVQSAPVTVTITVTPVNDAPVAISDTLMIVENTSRLVPAPGVLVDDTDVDGDTLTAVRVAGPSHGKLEFNPNGSFTYTPTRGWWGTDSFIYKAYDGKAYSAPATVTITVKRLAVLSLSAPSVSAYRSARLAGRLTNSAGKTIYNKPVILEYSYDKVKWTPLATVYTTKKDSKGWFYEYTARPTKRVYYRARFVGDTVYAAPAPITKTVLPKVSLTRPSFGRTTLAYGKTYKATGYLKPRHKAYTYPVKIAAYRYSSGKYRYVKTYSAKAFNYSSYTKYVRSIKLPSKGKWRLRVVHAADSLNAKTYSSYRYVTVK